MLRRLTQNYPLHHESPIMYEMRGAYNYAYKANIFLHFFLIFSVDASPKWLFLEESEIFAYSLNHFILD